MGSEMCIRDRVTTNQATTANAMVLTKDTKMLRREARARNALRSSSAADGVTGWVKVTLRRLDEKGRWPKPPP